MPNNQYRTNKLVQPKREFSMEETVTIITVSYNSTDVIEDMLLSVPSDVSVLVVDNASTDLSILKKNMFKKQCQANRKRYKHWIWRRM
jgi:glycosyltransferase involved in cell wall biosynthesis